MAHITPANIHENQISRSPAPLPGRAYKFGYDKREVYTESDLLLGADQGFKISTAQEYRYYPHTDYTSALKDKFESNKEKTINMSYNDSRHVLSFAQMFIHRDYARRHIYTAQVDNLQWMFRVGDQALLSYPRWGLEVPKQCVVTRIIEHAPTSNEENLTTLDLWG